MLHPLSALFEPSRDVVPWLGEQAAAQRQAGTSSPGAWGNNLETLHTINVERNGNVLYTWKGTQKHTHIGLFDPNNKKNQHLYTFEKALCVVSCSVNHEKTLLAVSFLQTRQEEKNKLLFQPVSKCLTLLIEIHPVNNVKVLKVVDSCVRVQFLYPGSEKNTSPKSGLLLISEDKYVEKLDIRLVREGDKVVMENSAQLSKERIADDLSWSQWDMLEQRLFYIFLKEERDTFSCIQFYPDKDFKIIFEMPLDISLADIRLKSVNLDYTYYKDQEIIPKPLDLQVFTSEIGSLCLCYSLANINSREVTYAVSFLHKGYSKTYTTSLEKVDFLGTNDLAFLDLDYYLAVYLPGQFLHLLNMRHPDLICHNFFLTGSNADIDQLPTTAIFSPLKSSVLDRRTGKIFTVAVSQQTLLQFLWNSKWDCERLAALHCFLLHIGSTTDVEKQIIQWIFDNISTCFAFDPIQELIIASLYWKVCLEALDLNQLLPYTSLLNWSEDVPGIVCNTHIISLPFLKVQNFKGFWEKLHLNLEHVKCVKMHLRFNPKMLRMEWNKLVSEENTAGRTTYIKSVFENARKVLTSLNTWETEERTTPLFQDKDYQQNLLIGLMVAQLKDHLFRSLQHVEKKKIDQIAVDYVSKLLDLICQMMENVWKKCSLHSTSLSQPKKAEEVIAFHVMCQIMQAANGMSLPLPPGFYTLLMELGMKCLPFHAVLQYIDHGVLHLTEKYVMKLWKELDNTEANMKLKLSVISRLPQEVGCKVCELANHSLNSSSRARDYIKLLFEKFRNKQGSILSADKLSTQIDFLPLNYLVTILADMERQGWAASVEPGNMNASLVEELAFQNTTLLLGL